jgi:hypothetical protein
VGRNVKRALGPVVGIRELREVGGARKVVTVRLGKPRKDPRGDWICPYQVNGLGRNGVQEAHGVDALQALQLALEGIRTALDRSGKSLSWTGGEPGDTGFTRSVPAFFGLDFSRRLEQLIDHEVEQFSRAAEAKGHRE